MKKVKVDLVLGILLISLFSLFFLWDCINVIQYQVIEYDEGYNATVAANVMRYGEYRVSYPSDTIFYNKITTGEMVLLPTALLYKIWGINSVTSSIVAVVYGLGCIFAVWGLLKVCLKDFTSKPNTLAAVGCILLILSDSIFEYVSTHLIGETAALFFILIGFIFIKRFYDSGKPRYFFLSGCMFAFSFLTKSSMIFIVSSIMGLIAMETLLVKSISLKHTGIFISGFACGFFVLDAYKLFQLGGISPYLKWWADEWGNMLSQSSGIDTTYSIADKIIFLKEIFSGCNAYLCVLLTILPVVVWLAMVVRKLLGKAAAANDGLKVMTLSGICGSSLIAFFVLLGGSGLVYARRHEVNQFLVRLYAIFFALVLIAYAIRKIEVKRQICAVGLLLAAGVTFAATVPIATVKLNYYLYVSKEHENVYPATLMDEFLDEVDQLPEDAVLYCAGWWQEPDVSLYLDRDMKDIFDIIYAGEALSENGYFIVGNYIDGISKNELEEGLNAKLVRVDTSEIDYDRYVSSFDRRDFDNFAIYKICVNPSLEIDLGSE